MAKRSSLEWHERKLVKGPPDQNILRYNVPCYITNKDWTHTPSGELNKRIVAALEREGIKVHSAYLIDRHTIRAVLESEDGNVI